MLSFPAPPTFVKKPQYQKVGLNGIATFECVAQGNPPPSVFWTKEGSQVGVIIVTVSQLTLSTCQQVPSFCEICVSDDSLIEFVENTPNAHLY